MPCLAQETLGSSPWAEVGPQLDPLRPGGGKKWVGLSETPAEVRGVGSAGEHPASSPTSSFTDKKKVAWSGVTFRGSPSKWGPPVRLGLVSGGAGQVACSLGWHRPGAGGDRLARTGGGRRPPAFWPLRSSAFVLSLFSICQAPAAFQASPDCAQGNKRADEREISGGSGSPRTDTVAAGRRQRGPPPLAPRPGLGLTTSYTARSSEEFCTWLSESLWQPWEKGTVTSRSTKEEYEAAESSGQDRNRRLGDFQWAKLTLAPTWSKLFSLAI